MVVRPRVWTQPCFPQRSTRSMPEFARRQDTHSDFTPRTIPSTSTSDSCDFTLIISLLFMFTRSYVAGQVLEFKAGWHPRPPHS